MVLILDSGDSLLLCMEPVVILLANFVSLWWVILSQGLLENLGFVQEHINVYCDSQSTTHLTKNQVYHARTKHIDVRFHFVREIVDERKIFLQKIKTVENLIDMLIKVVTTIKFEHCQNLINILQVWKQSETRGWFVDSWLRFTKFSSRWRIVEKSSMLA